MSGFWYTEKQTPNLGYSCKFTKTLHTETTPFQELAIIDTEQWGRMLVLDNMVMTTINDEFVYHEMISHVALNTHPNPKKVMIIGGGDGGAIRECVKNPKVEKAVLCEIDGRVIETSKMFLPEIAEALFDHPKVEILVADGVKHIQENAGEYDVIMVDSTEPIGPAAGLFAAEFYQAVYRALKPDGIMVAQTESPFVNADLIRRVFKDIGSFFPITKLYTAAIPTYPSGLWTFTMGSKVYDPEQVDLRSAPELATRYYTPAVHKAAFCLPRFVEALTKGE